LIKGIYITMTLSIIVWGLTYLALPAGAQGVELITVVEISGKTRTKDGVVLKIAKVSPGDAYTEGLEKDVERRLLNSRMFYDVKVEAEKGAAGVKLKIQLKDKWSLFPFPMVSFREGEARYGISFMESNLLGYHKRLFGAVFYEKDKLNETLMYFDKNVYGSDYLLRLAFMNTNILREVWDKEGKINGYYQSAAGTDIGLGYTFSNDVSITLGYKLHWFRYEESKDTSRMPENARESAIGIGVGLDKADHKEDFTEGFTGRAQFERDMEILGSELNRTLFNWRMSLYLNPVARHNLVLSNTGAFGRNLPYGYALRVTGLKGYERDRFEAERVVVSTVEYRAPIRSFKEMSLSFVPFADNAVFKNQYQKFTLKESKTDAGISLRVYLRRMTLPVFQVYSAYGFGNRRVLSGVSLGMAF